MSGHAQPRTTPPRQELLEALTNAGRALAEAAESLRQAVEPILSSCRTVGTRGAALRGQLLAKAQDLRRLTELCARSSRRVSEAGARLAQPGQAPLDLERLLAFSRCLQDQIRCEQTDAARLLGKLKGAPDQNELELI